MTEHWYVYDGWNLIKEQTTGGTTSTDYYVWGFDLSGTLQGAGGIGGLLSTTNSLTSTTYLYTFDANGNVGQLVDASDGSTAAHYEYDSFGKLLVSTGSEADSNVFRFSTKYYDVETGLYYYGYRYYSPRLGRWPTRDPLEEEGGLNVYGFVGNNPINATDLYGLACNCGIDITFAIVRHLNEFIAQERDDLSFFWWRGGRQLSSYARRNGYAGAFRQVIGPTANCGKATCSGTVTLGDMCIAKYHIDHILVMAYMSINYTKEVARLAGQLQEDVRIGVILPGAIVVNEASSETGTADLQFNEVALCFADKMKPAKYNFGTIDPLTSSELVECTKKVNIKQRRAIAGKADNSANRDISICAPCPNRSQFPSGLTLPPLDLWW